MDNIQRFSLIEKNILKLKGLSDKEIEHLESFGMNSKATFALVGDAQVLSDLSGIDLEKSKTLMQWATDGANSNPSTPKIPNHDQQQEAESSIPFELKPISTYEGWIQDARMNGELNENHIEKFRQVYQDVSKDLSDTDEVFNFARILTIMMQPALDEWGSGEPKSAALHLIKTSEVFYKKALEQYPNHGRAHIMLGTQLSQQKRYQEAIPHLEAGLTLPEASDDWMIAANWYILANINTGNTFGEVTLVFEKFKNHAVEGSYFAQMAERFESHIY